MTPSTMPAGAELDRLVAVKVMGREAGVINGKCRIGILGTTEAFSSRHWFEDSWPWDPSRDVSDTWEVVELLISKGYQFVITNCGHEDGPFACDFVHDDHGAISVHGGTMPLAVCRAALAAVAP